MADLNAIMSTLRQGGERAVVQFIKSAQQMHAVGGEDHVVEWVKFAFGALSDSNQKMLVVILLDMIFSEANSDLDCSQASST